MSSSSRRNIDTVRTLGAVLLWRLASRVGLVIGIIVLIAYAFTFFMTLSFSSWWLLLLVVLVPLTGIIVALGLTAWLLQRALRARRLSKQERMKLYAFIDTLIRLTEQSRTPYPLIIILVAKDVLRGKESTFLRGMVNDSQTIRREFGEIQALF